MRPPSWFVTQSAPYGGGAPQKMFSSSPESSGAVPGRRILHERDDENARHLVHARARAPYAQMGLRVQARSKRFGSAPAREAAADLSPARGEQTLTVRGGASLGAPGVRQGPLADRGREIFGVELFAGPDVKYRRDIST